MKLSWRWYCDSGARHEGGYTLVELLAVLAILSVLALGVAPLAELTVQRRKEDALREALWQIRSAIDAYKRAADQGLIPRAPGTSGYPPNLLALVDGVPGAGGQRQYFLRRLPRDPFAPVGVEALASWRLRSYDSPPNAPHPGADVYDVHSMSDGRAMDGDLLKNW
ncbi:type II secretion system protein [Roseateles sp. BYS78W]|uniref:Type II secretion system protein n=1 Tax=Pelomonas candidula TaxID=3299025 RepID=A0ABW7HH04_9BURK